MTIVIRWFGYLAAELLLLFSQLIIINLLPAPWNFIQVIWVLAPILILLNRFHLALGLIVVFYFYLGLFSVAPFGLSTTVGVMSIILAERLYRVVLTNRSVYSAAALSAFGTLLTRLLTVIFLLIAGLVTRAEAEGHLIMLVYEILLNTILASLIFLSTNALSARFRFTRFSSPSL